MSIDTSKIIHAPVGGGRYTVTAPIVKEDYGLYLLIEGLELPSTYEVDFSNSEHSGTSVTMIGNSDGVLIPSQFISSGKDVFAFLYHVGDNYGRTVFKFRIPNKLRPDRTNETPTPEQQSTIDQAINALNNAVEQTSQDVLSVYESAQNASASADRAERSESASQLWAETAENYSDSAEQSASQASASATASANSASQSAQIKDDVESMVDDAQASADASAQSATASANSASQASASATSASQSASSAQGYASQAQTSTQTASSKATEASGYASTASAKATESAQSASQALTYKTDAESAKTASQTAQGLAEQARDTAVSAKTDAESARDDAEGARDEAQQAVASISGALADKAPVITDTASGAIASFSDGADDIPLKSLVVNIDPVQDTSSGDPSPENICPISGWTGVNVQRMGVNVWDEEWEVGSIAISTGANASTTDKIRSANYIPCVGNTSYCFLLPWAHIFYYDADYQFISYDGNGVTENGGVYVKTKTTPSNARYMRFRCSGTYGTTYNHDISINYPSTDHSYHPYTGRSITIPLGQTVYGGKLDVLSGVLRVDKRFIVVDSTKIVRDSGTRYHVAMAYIGDFNSTAFAIMNKFRPRTGSDGWNASGTFFLDSNNLQMNAYRAFDTRAEFIEEYGELQLCYTLATPIEIQLTPHEVKSLLGQNNIFADTGDTSAEYRADTKLYISRLTEPDADMIADSNITIGQYFMVGNSLFKATANIASGASVIVGTNCTRKSLSEALNEINA